MIAQQKARVSGLTTFRTALEKQLITSIIIHQTHYFSHINEIIDTDGW